MKRNDRMIARLQSTPVTYPIRFTMCGDNSPNGDDPLQDVIFGQLLQQMESLNPTPAFFVNLGDFAGPGTLAAHQHYVQFVDSGMSIPNLCIAGDHELDSPDGEANFEEIYGQLNYHFTFGNALFVALHGGHYPTGPSEVELAYLETCLESHRHVPFKAVFLHQPPNLLNHYRPVGHYGFRHLEAEYVKLLHDYQVQLVCSAHITAFDWSINDPFHVVVSGASGYSQLCYSATAMAPYRGCFHHFVEISVHEDARFSARVIRAFQGTNDLPRFRFGSVPEIKDRVAL